jgi:hypothetical protein
MTVTPSRSRRHLLARAATGLTFALGAALACSPAALARHSHPPSVSTGSATNIASLSATLGGSVNPNGYSTTYHFDYGPTTSYGSSTSGTSAGSGTSSLSVQAPLSSLLAATTYHFRLVASNSYGTSYGSDQTFITLALPSPPANTSLPSVSGSAVVGQVLSASPGSWSGSTPMSYSYQWQDNGTNISGATSSSYTLASSDAGAQVDVVVNASNSLGSSSASSAPTATVTAPAPTPTVTPTPTWNGSFSTGDWSQYDSCTSGHMDGNYPSDYAIDTLAGTLGTFGCGGILPNFVHDIAPPPGFTYAARYTNLSGDRSYEGETGERTKDTLWPESDPTTAKTHAYQGADTWYRDDVYFPAGFQPTLNTDWNWILELHNYPDGPCCSNLSISVVTNNADGGPSGSQRLSTRILGGGTPANPIDGGGQDCSTNPDCQTTWLRGPTIQTNHWYDMVWHIHWDWRANNNSGQGLVEWWLDGVKIGSYSGPNLYYYSQLTGPGQAYLSRGYYRPTDAEAGYAQPTNNVYHAATMLGPTATSIGENLP